MTHKLEDLVIISVGISNEVFMSALYGLQNNYTYELLKLFNNNHEFLYGHSSMRMKNVSKK